MNAVIYARYSSHNQTEQSIEGQLHDCYAYAQREGLTVIGEYIDRALTGKNDNRPDFQRMIHDASKKQFQRVLVWKLDRFTRNRYDSAIYKYKLKQFGVKVLSVMENIGDSPESVILEAVLEASAQYYSDDLALKINRGMRETASKGLFVGGVIPFGYRVENRRLVVDERNAEYVRYCFAEYAAGTGKKELLDYLNARGVRSTVGRPVKMSFFETMFKNRKYIGEYSYNGVPIEGGCPSIVDPDVFDRVQARVAASRHAPAARRSPVEYLLVGKIFCGYCGAPFGAECGRGKNGQTYHYYACAKKKADRSACHKLNEKKDFIEWYICEQTREFVLDPSQIGIIASAVVASYDKEFNRSDIIALEKKAARIEAEIEAVVSRIINPDTPKALADRLVTRSSELETQKIDVEIDLAKLRVAASIRYSEKEIVAFLRSFCNGDLFDMDFRRRLIDTFVNSIFIYDDKIVIYYNVKESKQVSYIDMIESTDLENLVPLDPPEGIKKPAQSVSRLSGNGGA